MNYWSGGREFEGAKQEGIRELREFGYGSASGRSIGSIALKNGFRMTASCPPQSAAHRKARLGGPLGRSTGSSRSAACCRSRRRLGTRVPPDGESVHACCSGRGAGIEPSVG